MSKKGTKALASATLLSLVLTTALSAGPVKAASAGQVTATRTSGADRYETAATVATKNWTTSDNVVLVDGEGYADAVSASVLAKTLNAPILLTQSDSLSSNAATALSTLKAKNVYVIGGTASISQSIRDGLKSSGYNLTELGGANRYETNVAVANELVKNHGVNPANVMVVGGEGFSDALSVAPVAAAKGQILLLGSNSQSDMQSVINFVNSNKSKATVVGTSYVMGDSILKALGVDPSTRVNGGADRFATNLNVLNAFASSLNPSSIYVANATADDGYADALVASALAGKSAAPLVLVDTDSSSATQNALDYIGKEEATTTSTSINVVGGTGVVSDNLYQKLGGTITPTPTNSNDVESIQPVGLNQIKVTFGADVDSDSAEDVTNYKIDGTSLTADNGDNGAVAELQSDNRTVLITLGKSKEQQKSYTVSVKNNVLTADKSSNIAAKDQTVTFSDTAAPTVTSVTPKGNSKVTVTFSEPVMVPVDTTKGTNGMVGDFGDGKYVPSSAFTSKFKINGQNITSFGLDRDDGYTVTKYAAPTTTGSSVNFVWADKVDFYFTSKLPAGSNTLEVSQGDSSADNLADAAGFTVQDQTQNFTVDDVSTKPTVKSVDADPDGTLWVRFDRAMDSKTATDVDYYQLNGKSIYNFNSDGTHPTLALKENDCTVKIKGLKQIPFGSNTLYIENSINDAYGNTVPDNTRVGFTMAKDETKPTVKSVSMIDSETVRVVFSKDIDAKYATNLDNYTLKDSSGVDITKHIKEVKPASAVDQGYGYTSYDNDSVWDIKMWKTAGDASAKISIGSASSTDDWRLNNSKYSLAVKNLVDTTFNQNAMDEYDTTLNGTDDVSPKMTAAYAKHNSSDNRDEVVIFFSEEMDSSTLNDLSNYSYKDSSNDTKSFPSDTKITPGNDDKSVTLEVPSSYRVNGASNASGIDGDNIVYGVLGSGLKDVSGNAIDSFNNTETVQTGVASGDQSQYKDNTYRMEYASNGDDLLVKFQYTRAIDSDSLDPSEFTVAGQHPDSATIDGSDVELKFNKGSKAKDASGNNLLTIENVYKNSGATYISGGLGLFPASFTNTQADDSDAAGSNNLDKIQVIKLAGPNATLTVDNTKVKDITGTTVQAINSGLVVYNYDAAPKTTSDYWYATTEQAINGGTTTAAAVVLSFDSNLYTGSGVRPDDYTFTDKSTGTELKADNVVVKGNTVIFEFIKTATRNTTLDTAFASSNNIGVQLNNKSINITAPRDDNGDYAKYVPSDDDNNKQRTVPVYSNSSINLSTLFNN